MAKAAEAFRNIGELSDELGIKKHVLRFWELKFPQLKPMKRGGGRRLYRPSDVDLLRGIRDLLQTAGYTIKGVQKLLREHGIEHVKSVGGSSPDSGARHSQPHRPVFVGAREDGSMQLSAPEVEALRSIATELAACQALLDAAARGESRSR